MRALIEKAFGEISEEYYLKQAYFGMLPLVWVLYMAMHSSKSIGPGMYVLAVMNAILYPYAYLVYKNLIGAATAGKKPRAFYPLALIAKLCAMTLCWIFAIVIVPLKMLHLCIASDYRIAQ